MSWKLLYPVLIATLLLALPIVTAQTDYYIQAKFRTNLRAAPSLDSRVVTTAEAGETLLVLGISDRWLKINRKPYDVWMAEWVAHTRVEASVSTQSEIDNCCFVDRQCANDHEWTAGYWAYQNNQCGPPVTPQITETTAIDSDTVESVDNCCQIGWLCQSDQEWRTGYIAFHTNQCEHYGIEIEGPDSFVAQLHRALDLIRDRSPYWYAYIIDGLTKVRYDPQASFSFVYSHSGVWHVPPSRVEHSFGDMTSIVGSLAHEACHVHRHLSGQGSYGLVEERACLEQQIAAVTAIFPTGSEGYLNWATDLLANIENPEYQWWH